jgi:hypothetical protein
MNWVAIIIAVLVNMALGALWFSPLLFDLREPGLDHLRHQTRWERLRRLESDGAGAQVVGLQLAGVLADETAGAAVQSAV